MIGLIAASLGSGGATLPDLKKSEIEVDVSDGFLVIDAEPNREDEAFFRRSGRRIISPPDGSSPRQLS